MTTPELPGSRSATGGTGTRDLTKGPIAATLVRYALPILGGNALQTLNGSVNQFWVSHSLGVNAVTAIGNANLVMMLMLGAIFGMSMAANILIGQSVGARDLVMLKRVVGSTITFFAVLSVLIGIAGYFCSPLILQAMRTPPGAVPEAETYLRIAFLAMPFLYMFSFVQMAQRGIGDSHTPFLFMLLAVLLDMILNPLLIRGIGPFPRLAIAGSAISTLIAQGMALCALIVLLYRRNSVLTLGWHELHLLRPDPEILGTMIWRGLPMSVQMLVVSGSAMFMMGFVNRYGAMTAAAYTAASQVWTYLQMPAMAMGAAISAMAAQNIGANRWDRVELVARSGVTAGVLLTGGIALVIYLLGDRTLHIFLPPGSPALPIAVHINGLVLWSFVVFSVTFSLAGVVRASGTVLPILAILFAALFLVRIPFAALLTPRFGADAIWWSFPLGSICASTLVWLYYRFGDWRKNRMLKVSPIGEVADGGAATPAMAEHMADAETGLA